MTKTSNSWSRLLLSLLPLTSNSLPISVSSSVNTPKRSVLRLKLLPTLKTGLTAPKLKRKVLLRSKLNYKILRKRRNGWIKLLREMLLRLDSLNSLSLSCLLNSKTTKMIRSHSTKTKKITPLKDSNLTENLAPSLLTSTTPMLLTKSNSLLTLNSTL